MHLALYRKYRSATFDEVISQEHITTTLKNQIKAGTPAHAYLFTGSRGTGKTTCAKLMAKAVNCLSPVDGNPCGECESCKAIAAGCPDIIEMDAASNNGVDDVRALRDEVMYAPTVCRYKVYIIDEVHMLSSQAFNALLKTIEEPPPHVIFILATTEIHKVPATIASRCQQFRFSRIDVEESTKRLCEIAKKENVNITEDAARLISRLSDGGMRDAVSLLDQCISVSADIDEETVRTTAGIAGTEHLFTLAQCIHEQNAPEALKTLDELHNQSKDLMLLLDELLSHFRNLCILSATNSDFSLIPAGSGTRNDLARQTKEFTLGEIMRCMDILQDCIARTPKTAKRKTVAEMCLIRLCTPRLDSDTSALSLRLEKLENRLDKLCDGEISIQPRTAVQTGESTEKHIPAQSAKPVSVAGDRPQDIIADTLNRIENKITSADDKQKDVTAPTAPVQQSGTERNAADSKPDWLFEGTGGADDNASAGNEDIPPFDLDEPQANVAPAPQEQAGNTSGDGNKPDWLFEGTGGADDNASAGNEDAPPFDLDEPQVSVAPPEPAPQEQASNTDGNGDKPNWLFEGTGGTDDNASAGNEDAPPFDLDEPQASVAPQEQTVKTGNNLPEQNKKNLSAGSAQSTGNADPQVTEILDRLPVILQAILGQVQVTLGRDTVNISGYQKFQYDFLTTGDSKERLEKAAEEITGRRLVMTFDNNGDTAESKDKSDPVSDFLSRAEKMGVKIKYKKPKN
ncbi:DNA polymerase III subunit gamma/tau [[Eubacterium] siraeum]|uniref:DNA-directed DNA polymerase n=1 Tax=[Eubacterium] siraeum TaxID=39492 RepID=A0AAW6CV23_9FIRM|nr:DNA polymerase III subunit gamma/tau [[Eubacterium] siraeum]MDB8003236.1 DNA polymerase III subunit gamma/tau [[Eubacterium] siraeum]